MKKKLKIQFVGLYEVKNFGDPIIAQCTEWLYKTQSELPIEAEHLNINCVERHVIPSGLSLTWYKALKKISNSWANRFKDNYFLRKYREYYSSAIKADTDLIVVVGGGLIKFQYEYFFASISQLLDVAEKKNIPVVLNAVGIEGYDAENRRCKILKKALRKNSVRNITVRDDLETLINGYFDGNPTMPCQKIADPAVWTSEAYSIKKVFSKTIGIGIGRGGLFKDNGKNFSPKDFCNLYCELIRQLTKEGCQVELYTNGANLDNKFAKKLHGILQKDDINVNLRIPETPQELVSLIASYKCVIAARLHSCIVAYSLNVPAIGFVWNDKLSLWGKNIQAEEFFIELENLNVDYILSKLEKLLSYHYNENLRTKFRSTIKQSISGILKTLEDGNL